METESLIIVISVFHGPVAAPSPLRSDHELWKQRAKVHWCIRDLEEGEDATRESTA